MAPPEPLSVPEVQQLIRYWLACVRQEEALAARPRAQRPPAHPPPVSLIDPGPGLGYLRLDRALPLLTRTELVWEGPFDAPTQAFFERWLTLRYRAELAEARGRPEQARPAWFVGWPVVHFETRGELASLLRQPVQAQFLTADGKLWKPPSYRERKAGQLPPPPVGLRLVADPPGDDVPPFSVDPLLLSRTLGVNDEELAALFEVLERPNLSPGAAVAAVCATLDPDAAPLAQDAPPAAQLETLEQAIRARLPLKTQVYPVGLLYDGSAAFATWHLQRDLVELLRQPPGRPPWGEGCALWAYLAGKPLEPGWRALSAVRQPHGLTASQREVAERALGSPLCAAQGPPGTGKTELIGSLAADALARRALALAAGGEMPDEVLLITSTNNRAVDNAVDPLAADTPAHQLPIALRVGSQPVIASVTADLLGRVLTWLDGQAETPDPPGAYQAALARLRAAADALEARTAPQSLYQQRQAQLDRLRAHLAGLGETPDPGLAAADLAAALQALRPVQRRLDALQDALVPGDAGALIAALKAFRRLEARDLPRLRSALQPLSIELRLSLPPALPQGLSVADQLDAWEAAGADAVTATDALLEQLLAAKAARKAARRRAELQAEAADLEALVAQAPPPADAAEIAHLSHAVFERARAVRERWAVLRAVPLRQAVTRALAVALEAHTLRRLFEQAPEVETWLRRLFPVWGCTLLSLGNTFPPEPACLDQIIIDEAGQCHPAYALSGLLRAQRALIIGDVHQLEPVVELTPADEARARRQAELSLSVDRLRPYRIAAVAGASAQSVADAAVGPQRLALRDHFRCQPEIIGRCDALCGYTLTVHTPARSLAAQVPLLRAPLLFAPVQGAQERARGSWLNAAEIRALLTCLRHLERGGVPPDEIAIITPYVAQLETLREALTQLGLPHGEAGGLATGTVHRFQGGERTVVLFSTVVTKARSLKFIDDRVNLLNVAISRAKDHLVIFGDPEILALGRNTRRIIQDTPRLG